MGPSSNNSPVAIEVQSLTKHFGDFVAVDAMSFTVKRGEVFGFLGPNGAGKSTTIRMLCGLLDPTYGTAIVGGYRIGDQSDLVKASIGYMSQRFSLYGDLTVEQNIDFYGGVYGLEGSRLRERKAWTLSMAGLEGKESVLTRNLAGGWKQRLALGCAMLHEPSIVFLDEPTGGVDPLSRRNFWDFIYSLSESGVTVFVTTHYMDEAEHCNTVGFVYAGKLIAVGPPTLLKQRLEQYALYEVLCDRPLEAMELLQNQPWCVETSIFGSAFHISTRGAEQAEREIRNILHTHGVRVERIQRILPSLEDVFIHMIAEEDQRRRDSA
jgi:ABC-2 type transport system ATP-binding protein